ncbi:MAG: SusE domain-containing protein [Fulvivirga sp.]|uniref:SusE domain-containing protein n=1 Tax=Fulvivirga sp. TaxID=1931237 RepID=UPI0032EFC394
MKLRNILFMLVSVGLLFSCSDDDERTIGTGLEALDDFTLNSIDETVALSSIEPEAEVTVSWSEAASGLESDVIYTWMAFNGAVDIANPALAIPSDNDGLANEITFTHQQLEDALDGLGVATGAESTITWTVTAFNGDILKVAESSTVTIRRMVDEIAPFSLSTPADGALVELNIDAPDAPIAITWESTFSGFGNDITYTWLADATGGDFSDPLLEVVSDNMGVDAQVTFTNQELEDFLLSQGVEEAGYLTIDWKVVASTADLMLESSETYSVELRRYNPIASKFLVGAATPGGWSWDAPTEIVEVSEGVFEGTLVFSNESFRVFDTRDDWGSGTNYPFYEGEGYFIDSRFENAMDGDQNFRFTGTPGEYTFTLNTVDKSIRLTVGDPIYLVGAATPGGWSWDAPTVAYQIESGVYEATLQFVNDSFRFFTSNGDWGSGLNYPHYEGAGYTIDANFENAMDGDQNFRFIGTPGEFTITVDDNNMTIVLN